MTGVLVTRPGDAAEALAGTLRARGFTPFLEPLLRIEETGPTVLGLDGIQALLLTSPRGVRAAAHRTAARDLPAYAVGGATARALTAAGFTDVRDADGDWQALAALVARTADPAAGPLLHPAGEDVAGDLKGALERRGFTVDRRVLYRAVPADRLSPATEAALGDGRILYVMLYSPRTGRTFARLVGAGTAGGAGRCSALTALCLSPAVAASVAGLPWAAVRTAGHPSEAALLELLPGA
jgi:uroporphyrinogen-III synthase